MATCSRVWGMTPSSAAMTSSAMSIPPTPASMLWMKRSWPGTSTIETSTPFGKRSQAKPRSMVMPRSFSSCEAVGVDAGQRLDERRLAVVDVAGGADDAHRG